MKHRRHLDSWIGKQQIEEIGKTLWHSMLTLRTTGGTRSRLGTIPVLCVKGGITVQQISGSGCEERSEDSRWSSGTACKC